MSAATSTILAGAAIAGGVTSAVASHRAGNTIKDYAMKAATDANQTQKDNYNQIRTDQMPYLQAGQGAISDLAAGVKPGGRFDANFTADKFQQDPGYQFRLQEGQKALERSAASKGLDLSGGTLKDLTGYNSAMASQEFGNSFSRYMQQIAQNYGQTAGVAGMGQIAEGQLGQAGMNSANQQTNTINQDYNIAGGGKASGYIGLANGINQAIGGAAGGYIYGKQGAAPQSALSLPNIVNNNGGFMG